MGDMGDYWREVKDSKKRERHARLAEFEDALPRITGVASSMGVEIASPALGHYTIRSRGGRTLIQYWPSSYKMQIVATGKVYNGYKISDLEKFLVDGDY